jgi:hypothetical protein
LRLRVRLLQNSASPAEKTTFVRRNQMEFFSARRDLRRN